MGFLFLYNHYGYTKILTSTGGFCECDVINGDISLITCSSFSFKHYNVAMFCLGNRGLTIDPARTLFSLQLPDDVVRES